MLLLIVVTLLTTLFSISSETHLELREDKRKALTDLGDRPVMHLNSPISRGLEALGIRENPTGDQYPRPGGHFQFRDLDNNMWKKTCRFNLGGHCLTEEMNRAAEIYYYLKSPESPGRRRRHAFRRLSRDSGYRLR